MKIAELTAYHVRIPLKKPIRHASHRRTDTDNLLVRCVLEDKTEGWGEGVPRDYVTGETIDTALALLRRGALADQNIGCNDFAAAAAFAERLHLADVPGDDRGIQGNAARCAPWNLPSLMHTADASAFPFPKQRACWRRTSFSHDPRSNTAPPSRPQRASNYGSLHGRCGCTGSGNSR